MDRRNKLMCAELVTLLVTSSPLLFLVLPSKYIQAHASTLAHEPGCRFPDFLQTKKNKNWMMDQPDRRTRFDVEGGKIYARYGACYRPHDHWRHHPGSADCVQSNYTRVCLAQKGVNKYLVRHLESTFGDRFVCVEFLRRGISVVQVKMSQIVSEQYVHKLCEPAYNFVDPWLWISEEHFRSPAVDCPFSAGLNMQLKRSHPPRAVRNPYTIYGHSSAYTASEEVSGDDCADSTTAPIRMESDCVERDGIVFNFKHESCLPLGSRLAPKQRALCMATWSQDGEQFAMLRADNNDWHFFCLRVTYHNSSKEVKEVALFDGWICPTSYEIEAARRYPNQNDASYLTPHMVFSVSSKRVISEPCSDELGNCHTYASFCRGLQCMRTCNKCFPSLDIGGSASREGSTEVVDSTNHIAKKATLDAGSRFAAPSPHDSAKDDTISRSSAIFGEIGDLYSGDVRLDENYDDGSDVSYNSVEVKPEPTVPKVYQRPCTFPEDMRGAWLQRTADEKDERILITNSTLHHPAYGDLDCITFSSPGDQEAPLRRVLWGHYDNGCYPRFTCIHYNMPAKSVMRYRLADMQQWPIQLSDDEICEEENFIEPPDMYQPGDKSSVRGWEVVRREGDIGRMACVLPQYIPLVVSFLDDRGRSGCFVHGTYYSPRAISLTFFAKEDRRGSNSHNADRDGGNANFGSSDRGATGGGYSGYGNTGNGFNGGVLWNATGSDGTYHAIDPYAPTDFTSEERFSHGRDLKRSHGKISAEYRSHGNMPVEHSSTGAQRHYFHAKSRHSRRLKASERTLEQRGNEGHGVHFQRKRRRRDTDENTFHKDTLSEHRADSQLILDSVDGFDTYKHYNKPKMNRSHGQRGGISKDEAGGSTVVDAQFDDKNKDSIYERNKNNIKRVNPSSPIAPSAPSSGGRYGTERVKENIPIDDHFKRPRREARPNSRSSTTEYSYECLAVMTYVGSYKSLLTATREDPTEILCWLVVDEYTIVILKSSSCNSQTAQRVLADHARTSKYSQHMHRILYLRQGEKDCDAMFPADKIWPEPVQILNQEDENSSVSPHARTAYLWRTVLVLQALLVVLVMLGLKL